MKPAMRIRASLIVALLAGASCGGSSPGGSGGTGGSGGGDTGGVAGTSAGGVAGTSVGGTSGVGGTNGGGTTTTAGTSGGGTAGTSGGGTGTGSTGGGNDEAKVPRCLADLVAPCTCKSTGECGPQTCFKQGITTTTATPDGGACNLTGEAGETRVFNADGSLCYSVRTASYTGRACEDLTISWWDAAGNEVASASGYPGLSTLSCSFATPTITCKATGETGIVSINWPHTNCPTACQ